jgi:hypothetical protein
MDFVFSRLNLSNMTYQKRDQHFCFPVIIWLQYEYRRTGDYFWDVALHLSTDGSAIYIEMYFYGFSHTFQTVAIVAPCHGSWFPVHRLIWFQQKRNSPAITNGKLDIYTGDDYGPFTAYHTAWLVAFLTYIELEDDCYRVCALGYFIMCVLLSSR